MTPRRALAGGLVVTGALLAGACSSGGSDTGALPTGSTSPTSSPKASTAPPKPAVGPAPLTGLPAKSTALRSRAALAVALVTPSATSAPQGLADADIVYDEAGVAGGTRYIAVFQSRDSSTVGPVGPTHPEDAKLLSVFRGALAFSGGTPRFVRQLGKSKIADLNRLTHGSAYDVRVTGSPYNIFASTSDLYRAGKTGTTPPHVLIFATRALPLTTTASRSARHVAIGIPGAPDQTWAYSTTTGRWRRAGDTGPGFANLIVQQVSYKTTVATRNSPSVDLPDLYGRGTSTVLTHGRVVRGEWSKPGARALTNYVDASGEPVRLRPGPTWIVLAPTGTTVSPS